MQFNAAQPWTVAENGSAAGFDLQAVAQHEIGHVLGLGHSAIGETEVSGHGGRRLIASGSVMFPIAFPRGSVEGRTLRSDDVAGVSDLYRPASGGPPLGGLAGHVRKDGRGVFGAHVVAYGLRSGQIVGGFSITDDGDYVINGLEPGTYVVRVEPLDDGDVESFFEDTRARRRRLRRHLLLEARRGAAQRRGRRTSTSRCGPDDGGPSRASSSSRSPSVRRRCSRRVRRQPSRASTSPSAAPGGTATTSASSAPRSPVRRRRPDRRSRCSTATPRSGRGPAPKCASAGACSTASTPKPPAASA